MVFWLMPALIALLLAGTIAQKWMGLYAAHQMFFSSFIFWVGPLPLPGGYLLLGILSINLTLKFLLGSEWRWSKAGINLTHLGALILLVGGLLTALTAHERYMVITEGQETPYMYDYIERELSIFVDEHLKYKIPFDKLPRTLSTLPFTIEIMSTCKNCEITKRAETQPDEFGDTALHGMAQFMALDPKPREKDPEADLSGLIFKVDGLDATQDGIYVAIEGMPAPIMLTHNEQIYHIMLGKAQSMLPFSLTLLDFVKESYPGTDKAKAFSSDIIIKDGDLEWPAKIEMNKPLRYKGYTFFQSSFERAGGVERSIFSVVENKGRLLPYIGTIILTAGLLLHIFMILRRPKKRKAS